MLVKVTHYTYCILGSITYGVVYNIAVLCPSYLILYTMTALSNLAYCRLDEGSSSSLLGNVVMDGEELRGGAGGRVREVCQLFKKITILYYSAEKLLYCGHPIQLVSLRMKGRLNNYWDLLLS